MDKFVKIGGIAVIGVAAFAAFRYLYKRIEKKLDDEEQAINQELESIGVPTKKLREEVDSVEDEGNVVKALAVGTMFNPNWDFDFVDPDQALQADLVISVMQEKFYGRNNQESKDLVFYFDIPNYLKSSGFKNPKIGDYIVSLKEAMEHAENNIVKFCPKPKGRLIGLIAVSYDDHDDPEYTKSDRIEIDDRSIYEELADDYHDGLVAFYEGVVNKTLPETVNEKLTAWVNSKWSGEYNNFKVIEITLAFRMSFKLQDHSGIGINYKTALETLNYFTSGLEIKNRKFMNQNNSVKYQNIMFCAPDSKTGDFSLTSYYYVNDKNKLDQDYFSY